MYSTDDRDANAEWYRRNRERTLQLFDLISPAVYYDRPIALRNPIVFYEGHLPAFSINTLVKLALGRKGVDERLEVLFARGIDPEDEAAARASGAATWPTRDQVHAYAKAADELIYEAIRRAELNDPSSPYLRRGAALWAILEHEPMHHETLLYMFHRLPHETKSAPKNYSPTIEGGAVDQRPIQIPPGRATLGARRDEVVFGWDNEFEGFTVDVPAFEIDRHNVTNDMFMEFVESGGYRQQQWWTETGWEWVQSQKAEHPLFWERRDRQWLWRGMFEMIPLPPSWPVYVSQVEAAAYAEWRQRRLPTEAEYHRAAFGTPSGDERSYPWGEEPPSPAHGNFGFSSWDPVPAGSRPRGASAWGVEDLIGNGWEWTASTFEPFPGFEPMPCYPVYSAEFFDGKHYVIKGASPATDYPLIRKSFRNWFRPNYPYVYAKFRTAR